MSTLPTLVGAAFSDVLDALGSALANSGGQVAGLLLGSILRKRQESAREILLEELSLGQKAIHDVAQLDELVAITYRYFRAAHEGTARLNLRLLAKVIAGQAHLGNLIADEFLYYADLLASLRREELILIATFQRVARRLSEAEAHKLWGPAAEELIPKVFPDEGLMRAAATACIRTGLLMTEASIDDIGFFSPSPLLDKLLRLASLDDAIRQES